MIGTNVVGRFADRNPVATFLTAATGAGVVLLLLVPLSAHAVTAVIVITLLGVGTMAIPPVATGLSVQITDSAPTLAVAITVSAFIGGIAAGSSIGGHTLDTGRGATAPATVGVVMVALGLIPLVALAATRLAGAEAPDRCAARTVHA